MKTLITFIAAVAPAIWLLNYFYKQDNLKPEPKGLIAKIFIIGIIGTLPVAFIELAVKSLEPIVAWSPILKAFFSAFIVAALCEEGFKLKVVEKFIYKNNAFDEVMDGIVYTIVASLGFACMENILYVMQSDISVAVMRALTAVPLHAICSGIMGYYIGKAKFSISGNKSQDLMLKGLLYAIIIHGTYNFVIFSSPYLGRGLIILNIPILFFSYKWIKILIKKAKEEDQNLNRI